MSGANARDGRRRRMLQEEVLGASRQPATRAQEESATAAESSEGREGRRYALLEGSLGGALAKRHFPSHAMVPVGVALGGAVAVAGVVAMHLYRQPINLAGGGHLLPLLDLTSASSLGRWFTVASMLVATMVATLVLAVRRRRVDDYQGRHRLWRAVIAMGMLLSIDAATNLHTHASASVSHLTGFALLKGGAEWSIAVALLLGGWIGVRVLLDIKESRLALAAYLGAATAYLTGVVAQTGWLPMAAETATLVAHAGLLSGHLLVVTSLVAYSRFLRHDVEGGVVTRPQLARLVESKPSSPKEKTAKEKVAKPRLHKQEKLRKQEPKRQEPAAEAKESGSCEQSDSSHSSAKRHSSPKHPPSSKQSKQNRKNKRSHAEEIQPKPAEASIWTDGTDGSDEAYQDDHAPRKMSKAERKRLRKQKTQRRAA